MAVCGAGCVVIHALFELFSREQTLETKQDSGWFVMSCHCFNDIKEQKLILILEVVSIDFAKVEATQIPLAQFAHYRLQSF